MRRREFIILLGSAAIWPLVAHAQQSERKIGVLMPAVENDPEVPVRVSSPQGGSA